MNSAMEIMKTTGSERIAKAKALADEIDVEEPQRPSAIATTITSTAAMAIDPIINVHKSNNSNNGGTSRQHSGNDAPAHSHTLTDGNNVIINSLPSVAYLQAATVESKPLENTATINNHNNNVFVDTYEPAPTAMELECVAGYDGGLPQYFVLEAYDSRTKKLRLNITSAFNELPLFRIDLAGK